MSHRTDSPLASARMTQAMLSSVVVKRYSLLGATLVSVGAVGVELAAVELGPP